MLPRALVSCTWWPLAVLTAVASQLAGANAAVPTKRPVSTPATAVRQGAAVDAGPKGLRAMPITALANP
jgi:hypothetical protein